MIFLFSSSSLYNFLLSSFIIRVYRMSFPERANRIYPIPLLERERYHRDVYCIHKEE